MDDDTWKSFGLEDHVAIVSGASEGIGRTLAIGLADAGAHVAIASRSQAALEQLPVGRWAQPEDLIGATLFLCSSLSDMVVGHILMVDGGWTIH